MGRLWPPERRYVEAEADRVDPDDLVREILKMTPSQPIGSMA